MEIPTNSEERLSDGQGHPAGQVPVLRNATIDNPRTVNDEL